MSPFEYLTLYHNFTCVDPRLGLSVSAPVTGYDNTEAVEGGKQADLLQQTLSKKYFHWAKLTETFSIRNEPKVPPTEEFYVGSIRRAYTSRGSPDEMRDALRLAVLVGLCPANGVAAYAAKWFKNDCVSFAGNYSGVSSSTGIMGYAEGFTAAELGKRGVAQDLKDCAHLIRIPPRKSLDDVCQGDLLLSFGHADSRGIPWRHIAVVEDCHSIDGQYALVSIAEWGGAGAAGHITRNSRKEIHNGSKAQDPTVYRALLGRQSKFKDWRAGSDQFVCFNGDVPGGGTGLRIFFDASSFADFPSRGWDVAT